MTKDLSSAISLLNSNHIYPKAEVLQGVDEREVVALIVDCAPIMFESRMNVIKAVIGDGFEVHKFPNDSMIRITLKK